MLARSRKIERWLLVACALLALVLSACGSSNAEATPSLSVDAIYTAAVQTFQAQQATSLALTPPTSTSTPTPSATLPPPSPLATISFFTPTLGGGLSACDNSAYVADITIPDGTTMTPGQKFEKKWKLQNTGSCTWSTSYQLAFASGELMGGAPSPVKVPVPSGNQAEIAVSLTAPTAAGTYTGTWRMQNASSVPFGNFITVVIKVGTGGATVTPGPSPTAGTGTTVTISGNAEKPQVLITYTGLDSGDTSGTTVAADDGSYSFTVSSGWSGTVAPSKGSWTFTPASKTYSNVTADQTGQDYAAH